MRPLLTWFLLPLLLLRPAGGGARLQESSPNVVIRSPGGGEAIQGTVEIVGNANPVDFAAYELSFGYTQDETGTWFVIAEGTEPVRNSTLAEWDTFAVTDGTYNLRLLVTLTDGSQLEHRVEGVRVRNFSPIETATPAPSPTSTQTPTPDLTALFTPSATPAATETPAAPATATPLPPNPAEIRPDAISQNLVRGGAGALAALALLGLYTSLQKVRRR